MKRLLYAGTFDPITNGHLDLIERGAKMCDTLIIGVIKNPSKNPIFTINERIDIIREATMHIPNVKIDGFEGLLVDYVKHNNIQAVLRGLRVSMDFEYEIQMAQMNASLYNHMETLFLMTDTKHSFVSSSMIKEVFSLGGEVEGFIPEVSLRYMKKKQLNK